MWTTSCARLRGAFSGVLRNQLFRRRFGMDRHTLAQDECDQSYGSKSRASGEMFIAREPAPPPSSVETRCRASRLDRRGKNQIVRFYKYFAPTALAILVLSTVLIFSSPARAQRRVSQ